MESPKKTITAKITAKITAIQLFESLYTNFKYEMFAIGGGDIKLIKNDKGEILYTVNLYSGYESFKLKHVSYDLNNIIFAVNKDDKENEEEDIENYVYKADYASYEEHVKECRKCARNELDEQDYTFDVFVKFMLITMEQYGEYGDKYLTITYDEQNNMYMIDSIIGWTTRDSQHVPINQIRTTSMSNIWNKFERNNCDPNRIYEFI